MSSFTRSLPVDQAAGDVTMADAEGTYDFCCAPTAKLFAISLQCFSFAKGRLASHWKVLEHLVA